MQRKRILFGLVLFLVLIQFIRIDKTNPPVDPKLDFAAAAQPPAEVLSVIRGACYDCHSDETRYPWYSNVAPVSWLVQRDVDEGREKFNVSTWGLDNNKADEAAEAFQDGEMPMPIYLITHPEAKLAGTDRQALLQGLLATFGGETGEAGDD